MPSSAIVVQAVITLAVSGTAAGLVSALFSRRKVSAEAEAASATAAQTITSTATELLEPLRAELADLRPAVGGLRRRVADLEGEQEVHRRLLYAHAEWDEKATQQLAQVGIRIDHPPPLYPDPQGRR